MNLYALLSWYDESPTWLSATVASLTRIGVTHLVAVDGRYPIYDMGAPACSRVEQVDAITNTAHCAGIEFTIYQPREPMDEVAKRALAFRLAAASATPMQDWAIVIDADEVIANDAPSLRDELAGLPTDTHVAAARLSVAVDPYSEPGVDNNVTSKTAELYHKLSIPEETFSLQSRVFRMLHGITCSGAHYAFEGADDTGARWNLRSDIAGKRDGMPASEIARLTTPPLLQHRKNHRTRLRRETKAEYYHRRNEYGIERVV